MDLNMARTLRTYRIVPNETFVDEWEWLIEMFEKRSKGGSALRFLTSVHEYYLDRFDRSISAKQAIAIDKLLSEYIRYERDGKAVNRKRWFKDETSWEHSEPFPMYTPKNERERELNNDEINNVTWLSAMDEQ